MASASTMSAAQADTGSGFSEKFLTLFLAEEEYGIEILRVREIIGMMSITWVPRMPNYIKGVINLRGKVIPIVDLRLKFGMQEIGDTDETCVIVVQYGEEMVGTVVDKVSEVVDIARDDIVEPPTFGGDERAQYILGIGKGQGGVKLLLDIDKVLSDDDGFSFQELSEASVGIDA